MKNVAARVALVASAAALSILSILPARADEGDPQLEIVNNIRQNLLQNIRDQVHDRLKQTAPTAMGFNGQDGVFDNRDPFAARGVSNPFDAFNALGYAKAPARAPAAAPAWIYGANLIGSGDRSYGFNTTTSLATIVGAFDATKIGVFTTTDAVSFLVTGSDTWSHTFFATPGFNSSTPSGSGTIAYIYGGFSTDFTASANWTSNSALSPLFPPPANSSAAAYTWNGQYRFDFPYTVFMEPTGGVTYTEFYTANFGTKTGDQTELHIGDRVGFETKWMGFTIQPSLTGSIFRIVGATGAGGGIPGLAGAVPGGGALAVGTVGYRGSAKVNIIWTPNFSSYAETHCMAAAGTDTCGAQAGLRYTW